MREYSDAIKKQYKTQTDNIDRQISTFDKRHRLYTEAILVNLMCTLADLTDEVKALREEIAFVKQQNAEADIAEHQQTIEKLKSELKRCCYGPRD